jgi:hypothetical protein
MVSKTTQKLRPKTIKTPIKNLCPKKIAGGKKIAFFKMGF